MQARRDLLLAIGVAAIAMAVYLPFATPAYRINLMSAVFASAGVEAAGPAIDLSVNGRPAHAQPLLSNWQTYEWDMPADALGQGLNRVTIDVTAAPGRTPANPQTPPVGVSELVLARPIGAPQR